MATCERCKAWIGDAAGPTSPLPGMLVCERCRQYEESRWQFEATRISNRNVAIVTCASALIILAVALFHSWRQTDPRGGNLTPPPIETPPEPDQVLPGPGERPDPEPGDDGALPAPHPAAPIPRAMTIDV